MLSTSKLETVADFTSRAIRSSNEIIPPTVFVPLGLKRSRKRILPNRAITSLPPDDLEMSQAVARAAPHEFLIAVMQGQPIPRFILTETEKGTIQVDVSYVVPEMTERVAAAGALHHRRQAARALRDTGDDGFDAAVRNAASRGDE